MLRFNCMESILFKEFIFARISVSRRKKMWRAHVRSILMPTTSHIASFRRHTLKFLGVGLKLTSALNRLAPRAFQSHVTQIRVHQKR